VLSRVFKYQLLSFGRKFEKGNKKKGGNGKGRDKTIIAVKRVKMKKVGGKAKTGECGVDICCSERKC
jgi:hypothetical protein